MKKHAMVFASLVALQAIPSYSQSMTDSDADITLSLGYVSAYMFRGVYLGGPSLRPSIEFSKGPLSILVGGNLPITNDIQSPDPVDPEFDFCASYEITLKPNVFVIKPQANLYTFPRAKKDDGFNKATFEPGLSLIYSVEDLNFTFSLLYDLILKGPTYEFGVDYSIPIKELNLELELFALVGKFDWSDSEAGASSALRNEGEYFQAGFSIPIEFSKRSKLTAGWYYEQGSNNYTSYPSGPKYSNPSAVGRGVINASFSYTF